MGSPCGALVGKRIGSASAEVGPFRLTPPEGCDRTLVRVDERKGNFFVMNEREIRAAKQHRNSLARMEITEKGIRAAATLLLEQLGEITAGGPDAHREAVNAVLLMAEVLGGPEHGDT